MPSAATAAASPSAISAQFHEQHLEEGRKEVMARIYWCYRASDFQDAGKKLPPDWAKAPCQWRVRGRVRGCERASVASFGKRTAASDLTPRAHARMNHAPGPLF